MNSTVFIYLLALVLGRPNCRAHVHLYGYGRRTSSRSVGSDIECYGLLANVLRARTYPGLLWGPVVSPRCASRCWSASYLQRHVDANGTAYHGQATSEDSGYDRYHASVLAWGRDCDDLSVGGANHHRDGYGYGYHQQ